MPARNSWLPAVIAVAQLVATAMMLQRAGTDSQERIEWLYDSTGVRGELCTDQFVNFTDMYVRARSCVFRR
jgi:hypothetical protein